MDAFSQDTIDHGYDNLQTTLRDVQRLTIPLVLLAAERDPWVRFQDVQQVLATESSAHKELHLVPAMHQLKENPQAARAAFRLIAARTRKYLLDVESSPLEVKEPSLRELAIQNRIERQRMRALTNFEKREERRFWTEYLDQFHFINQIPDYQQLLAFLHDCLRGVHPDEVILDAGCGNGTLGLWLMTRFAWQMKKLEPSTVSSLPIQCVCVDYVESALQAAEQSHVQLRHQLFGDDNTVPIQFQYRMADLDQPLPFADASFDKVCCNLVISYVRQPVVTLRELLRATRPGGLVVLTSLKPYADTSQIYRNYLQVAPGETQIEQARKLLTNAGHVQLKEAEGHFHFFSQEELLGLAEQAGLAAPQVLRCFADQANALVGRKT
ncbi:MAG: methyltransferase domain-containing protein [Elusimicrobia bacterium]|nr:methyltransferase domain-containing protein [Elusimicrobiota bacterium]